MRGVLDIAPARTPYSARLQCPHPTLPEHPEPIDYGPGAIVRKVQDLGRISFKGHTFAIGRAFIGEPVALRPTAIDGCYDVIYCLEKIAEIDLAEAP